MQAIRFYLAIITLLCLCIGCGKEVLDKTSYKAWIENYQNGLHKQKEVGVLVTDVQYISSDYMLLQEMAVEVMGEEARKERKTALDKTLFFKVRLSINQEGATIMNYGIQAPQEQTARSKYFSFDMQDDLYLEVGGKKKKCGLYHFEEGYDLTTTRTFMLGFSQEEAEKDQNKTLVLDIPIFNTGPIKIQFQEEAFKQIPELNYDEL